MSPLARSLLALVALIAAADAIIKVLPPVPGGRCAGFRMDMSNLHTSIAYKKLSFAFKASGDGQLHNIPNHCVSEGAGVIKSQTVKVCNEFDHPNLGMGHPPKVFALADEKPSPVFAACYPSDEASLECGLLTFHITQECIRMID